MPIEANTVTALESVPANESTESRVADTSHEHEAEASEPEIPAPHTPEYQEWRATGKLPASKAPSEKVGDSATPKGKDKTADTAADSATAQAAAKKGHQKTPSDTERRFNELREERRRDQERIADLERRLTDKQPALSEKSASQPAAQVADKEPKIDDVDATGKPAYKTFDEWMAAVRKFDREQILKTVNQDRTKTEQQKVQSEHARVTNENWQKKIEPIRKKYADFDSVALSDSVFIPPGGVVEGYLLESDHAGEVLYYLGQHPEVLSSFYEAAADYAKTGKYSNKISPLRQHRELLKIEAQFEKAAPAAKKITNAPRPPNEVGGRGAALPDPVEKAAEESEDDPQAVRRFIEADTRKHLSRLKGR